MAKIIKNRSDAEMFEGWKEPEIPSWSSSDNQKQMGKLTQKKEEIIESHLPESVRREMERLLMEMKLDFFKRGIQDIAYVLKKEGDILKISLEPKLKKEK